MGAISLKLIGNSVGLPIKLLNEVLSTKANILKIRNESERAELEFNLFTSKIREIENYLQYEKLSTYEETECIKSIRILLISRNEGLQSSISKLEEMRKQFYKERIKRSLL